MTLLERLQSHKGGLIRMKTELFWYGGRGWDNNPGRVCLVLDAAAVAWDLAAARVRAPRVAARAAATGAADAALLLIDGSPQWVWVAESDVEVLG